MAVACAFSSAPIVAVAAAALVAGTADFASNAVASENVATAGAAAAGDDAVDMREEDLRKRAVGRHPNVSSTTDIRAQSLISGGQLTIYAQRFRFGCPFGSCLVINSGPNALLEEAPE
jgi:hypothetical protein